MLSMKFEKLINHFQYNLPQNINIFLIYNVNKYW